MKGEERREKLAEKIREAECPCPAGTLAEAFGVSRQVIVQDVAVLRAKGIPVAATVRGYVWAEKRRCSRVFKVNHTDGEIGDELALIVNEGGTVEDVFVKHRVYCTLSAPLGISDSVQVSEFVRSITAGNSRPLKNVTDGFHYHTVSAESEERLQKIRSALKVRGYLVEE